MLPATIAVPRTLKPADKTPAAKAETYGFVVPDHDMYAKTHAEVTTLIE